MNATEQIVTVYKANPFAVQSALEITLFSSVKSLHMNLKVLKIRANLFHLLMKFHFHIILSLICNTWRAKFPENNLINNLLLNTSNTWSEVRKRREPG